jgi:hypothetical protein
MAMDKCSVIDIERDLANQGKRVLAIFVIENPYISCNQATKRVQRQTSYVGFDAAFVQFLHHAIAPFTPEATSCQIIAPAKRGKDGRENSQANDDEDYSAPPRVPSIFCETPNLRWFKDGWHELLEGYDVTTITKVTILIVSPPVPM